MARNPRSPLPDLNALFPSGHRPAGFVDTKSPNRRLRDAGLLPLKWMGTEQRLKRVGIRVERHPEARTSGAGPRMSSHPSLNDAWGPAWAVLVAEADPCGEEARDWALERAVKDETFRAALEAIAALEGNRVKMAAFIMGQWSEP